MKILVAGPSQCGKSSYIQFLDDKAINIDSKTRTGIKTTVGLDFGAKKIEALQILLFGTPGLLRFSIIRKILAEGSDGVIFIFDATNPVNDEKGITILNEIRSAIPSNTPIIFLANKSDLPNARKPEVIRTQNYIPRKYKFFPTSTKSGMNVVESLEYLVKTEILENWRELISILSKYETNIEGLAEKMQKDIGHIKGFLFLLEVKGLISFNYKDMTYNVNEEIKNLI